MAYVDFSVLQQLCELLGDEGKTEVRSLIDLYLEDGPNQIQTMKHALETSELESFQRAAHSFKSSSANIGAFELQELCQNMETNSFDEDKDYLKNVLQKSIDQFINVEQELNHWKASL